MYIFMLCVLMCVLISNINYTDMPAAVCADSYFSQFVCSHIGQFFGKRSQYKRGGTQGKIKLVGAYQAQKYDSLDQ